MAIRNPTDLVGPVGVLIVDDSSSFRHAARELLEYRGYVVAGEADSVRTAIAAVAALSPDAALIDVGLPDAPGTELANYLRTHHPGVRVLLCSVDPARDPRTPADVPGSAQFVLKRELAQVDLSAFWPVPAGAGRAAAGRP